VLISLGDTYTRKGFHKEGLSIDRKLARLKPKDPVIHYNLACSLSLLGKLNQSLQALKKAVFLGYNEFTYILKDPDLKSIRELPKFKSFFAKLKRLNKPTGSKKSFLPAPQASGPQK
jgi:hypothetical protein